MFIHDSTQRVRYGETDQMGVVYYGNYALYYEVGRVEALRSLGLSYKQLEEDGVMMPVLEMSCRYLGPVLYDELIHIRTIIRELPGARIRFEHEISDEAGRLLNTGTVSLAFVSKENGRPVRCPQALSECLKAFFNLPAS